MNQETIQEVTPILDLSTLDQGTKAWLEWRMNGIGASDAPIIMGKSKYKTKLQLWDEKVKKEIALEDEEKNKFVKEKGHRLEAYARAHYEIEIGFNFPPKLLAHKDTPFILCSLDGWSDDLQEGLEIKYLGKDDFNRLRDESLTVTERIPEQYFDQIMQQFLCTNAKAITLIGVNDTIEKTIYDKPKKIIYCLRILMNDEFFQYIKNVLVPNLFDFWKSVEEGVRPEPVTKDAVEIEDDELKLLLNKYSELDKLKKEYDDRQKELREVIINHKGIVHDKMKFGNFAITKVPGSISVDYKEAFNAFVMWTHSMKLHASDAELIEAIRNFPDLPNLEKYTTAGKESIKITIPKDKKLNKNVKDSPNSVVEKELEKKPAEEYFDPEIEKAEFTLMTDQEQVLQSRLNVFRHPETGKELLRWKQKTRKEKALHLINLSKKLKNPADKKEIFDFANEMLELNTRIKKIHADFVANKPGVKTEMIGGIEFTES